MVREVEGAEPANEVEAPLLPYNLWFRIRLEYNLDECRELNIANKFPPSNKENFQFQV